MKLEWIYEFTHKYQNTFVVVVVARQSTLHKLRNKTNENSIKNKILLFFFSFFLGGGRGTKSRNDEFKQVLEKNI